MSAPNKPYFSNGQALSSPPLSARVRSSVDSAITFGALYFVTLFSLDSYAAAEASTFSARNRSASQPGNRPSNRSTSGGGTNGGPNGGLSSGGGRRLGTVDSIRGPECRSCG